MLLYPQLKNRGVPPAPEVDPNHWGALQFSVIRSSDSMLCSETHPQLGTCPGTLIFLEDVLGCFGLPVKNLFIESSNAL